LLDSLLQEMNKYVDFGKILKQIMVD